LSGVNSNLASLPAFALQAKSQTGETLGQLADHSPVLLVFLRHAGCSFCKEALRDIATQRSQIEASGARIVLVHMSRDGQAEQFFGEYSLADVARISDPEQTLYRALDLHRGGPLQLFGPKVWWRGPLALFRGHTIGRMIGDGLQMPGVFLIHHGKIVRAFRHQSIADRPHYADMTCKLA
jgi:peroxiredoxin